MPILSSVIGRNLEVRTLPRLLALTAAAALVVAPLLALGPGSIPADAAPVGSAVPAFALPPVKPKPPVSTSSETASVAKTATKDAASAAVAGARLAGQRGVTGYNPLKYVIQGNIVGATLNSIGSIGELVSLMTGSDSTGVLCNYAANNPNDIAASAGIIDAMTGGQCVTADGKTQTGTVDPAVQNTDASAVPTWGALCDTSNHCLQINQLVYSSGWKDYGVCAHPTGGWTAWSSFNSGQYVGFYSTDNPSNYFELTPYSASQTSCPGSVAGDFVLYGYWEKGNPGGPWTGTADEQAKFRFFLSNNSSGNNGYPPRTGSPTLTPTVGSLDPTRWLTCDITGSDGLHYVSTGMNFKESQVWPAAPPCAKLPAGVTPGVMHIYLNGGPSVIDLTGPVQTTPEYQQALQDYPGCGNGACELHVWDPTGDCNAGDSSRCATWFTDPNKSTKYTCHYGQYTAPLTECNDLSNYYDPEKVAQGRAFTDPATGADPGVQTAPSTDLATMSSTPQDDGQPRKCFPDGWGAFNPLNWVMQPLQCLFMPRQSFMNTQRDRITSALSLTAISGLQSQISNWSVFGVVDGGCAGIPIDWTIYSEHTHIDLLKACPGDTLAPAASLTKTVISAVIATMGVLACLRYIAAIFGFMGFGRGGDHIKGPRFGPAPESGAGGSTESPTVASGPSFGSSGDVFTVWETPRKGIGS